MVTNFSKKRYTNVIKKREETEMKNSIWNLKNALTSTNPHTVRPCKASMCFLFWSLYKENRFPVTMGLFSNRSQKMSKCAARVSLPCFHYILTSSVIYYWTDARQNGIYLLNGHHAPVNDAKQFPKASHLSGLQILLDVCCYCPGFTGVQQSWDYQGVHKSDLWAKRDYYA